MQGTPQEESQDPPAPPAASQCGPHSLMFRPTGGRVSSLALHLCSASFLCVSAQHAFTSSPVMNSEVMGGRTRTSWRSQDVLEVQDVLRSPGGPSPDFLEVPGRPGGPRTFL
ncbi:unnamed protein product [Gadus morhua 'NCC']